MPVEIALGQADDVVHLLLSLGADVDFPLHLTVAYNKPTAEWRYPLDWISSTLSYVDTQIASLESPSSLPKVEVKSLSRLTEDTWNGAYAHLLEIVSNLNVTSQSADQRMLLARPVIALSATDLQYQKSFYQEAEAAIRALGNTPSSTDTNPHPSRVSYFLLTCIV